MPSSGSGTVVALVTHARDVDASERAAFAARIRERLAPGSVVLETCHRVEAYLVAPQGRVDLAVEEALPVEAEILVGEAAIRHAVDVAAGRDSVVDGEDQILHQLRTTVAARRRSRDLDPVIDRVLSAALRAGRQARSWHQGPRRSLADVVLELIEERVGPIRGRRILVVGAGTMGRLAVRGARARGADVAVASRTEGHSRQLASSTACRWEALDPGAAVGSYAGIVVALGGPWSLGDDAMRALGQAGTVVVDLSQPPAVTSAAADVLGVRLVTADALARLGPPPGSSQGRAPGHIDDLVDRTVSELLDWLAARPARDAAALIVDRADREREAELAELWRRHPGFAPEARAAIEAMTRHLARRILRQPLERLGRDVDGRGAEAARDLFSL